MYNINTILRQEVDSYSHFTNREVIDCGIIYHNTRNPQSHDSNHAHILNLELPIDTSIHHIISFYTGINITPRIYASFIDRELDILRPYLEKHGFTISTYDNTYMLLNPLRVPKVDDTVSVHRITRMTPDIAELVQGPHEGDWAIKVLAIRICCENIHLLGLHDDGRYLTIASVEIMDGYTRVDDVVTHPDYRRRRLGTKLMTYLATYHRALSDNYLYLWTNNPVAVPMYRNAGFEEITIDKPSWSACLTAPR